MKRIDLSARAEVTQAAAVSSAMFGGNILFKFDNLSGANATYDSATKLAAVHGLRYPGGTMTEINFDVNNPDAQPIGSTDGKPYVGLTEFLNYAAEVDQTVDLVIPTKGMYRGTANANFNLPRQIDTAYFADVVNYVRRVLKVGDSGPGSLPDVPISSLEIGNEYWGGGKMTATEYGRLVNELLPALEQVIEEEIPQSSQRPKILIQMGSPLDPQFKSGVYSDLSYSERLYTSNWNIIEQIKNPIAINAIDGLIQHYYYSTPNDILVKNTWTMNSIDECFSIWSNFGFSDRSYYITEWNVGLANASQLGLKGASILIEQFSYMVELGVDAAFCWPVQGYDNGLIQRVDGQLFLTPIGAAFKLMSESLIGTRLLPYESQGGDVEVESYGSASRIVLFVASRTNTETTIEFDISKIILSFNSVSCVQVGVEQNQRFDDPSAVAVERTFGASEVLRDGLIHLDLGPFEFARVVFDISPPRQIIGGVKSERLVGAGASDTIVGGGGNDTLRGFGSGDRLVGGMGADLAYADGGNDTVFGGLGEDKIYGGLGDDLIFGQGGNDFVAATGGRDTIFGGFGDDRLQGGKGDAVLYGGVGCDTLLGFEGNDTLIGGYGGDVLAGGVGADVFRFEFIAESGPMAGSEDTVLDFDRWQSDRIDLSAINAWMMAHGLHAINWIGAAAFSQSEGQLRFGIDPHGVRFYIDPDGDGIANFSVRVLGVFELNASDFIY